ncbi:MAG: hypothetical protein U1E53_07970 [Dongiaceae bacterium]
MPCRPQDDLAGGGSYGQTCGNCTIENGGLGCSCSHQGTYAATPKRLYYWACRSVTISNGQLTCSWNGNIADRCTGIQIDEDLVTVGLCDALLMLCAQLAVNASSCPDHAPSASSTVPRPATCVRPMHRPRGGSRESSEPTLEAVEPPRGNQGATLEVVFSGSNLDQPLSAGAPGVTVSKLKATGPSRLTATLRISPKAQPGPSTIRLKTRTGTATIAFTIVERRVPRVTSVSPAKGLQGTATQMTFKGSNLDTVTAIEGTGGITAGPPGERAGHSRRRSPSRTTPRRAAARCG